jgi:hypothetical protein
MAQSNREKWMVTMVADYYQQTELDVSVSDLLLYLVDSFKLSLSL